MKSRGEKILAQHIPELVYEPCKLTIERPYVPDFITPDGVFIEVKEFLTPEEYRRIRDAHLSIVKGGGVYVVLIFGFKSRSAWPKKGHAIMEYLQKAGFNAACFDAHNSVQARKLLSEVASSRAGTWIDHKV